MENIQTLPSANQIWYTSSDGAVINPSARYFSARLVSNTYEQGWGVITFNKPLTDIGWNAFFECKTLKSVVFPLGVVEIANGVCKGCTALDKVVIPDSVTKIGDEAFALCDALQSVSIPESVEDIGKDAFDSHTQVTRRAKSMPADNEIWYSTTDDKPLEINGGIADGEIEQNIYQNGVGILRFGADISTISKNAFYDCKTITSVTFPRSVTSVGEHAFSGCTELVRVTMTDSVKSIAAFAFEGCRSLKILDLGEGIECLGEYAFARCLSLKSFVVPERVQCIAEGLLSNCTNITKVYLGSSVSKIEQYAFERCRTLQEFYCKSTQPIFGADMLPLSMGTRLYVPQDAVERYKISESWSQYAERIFGYTPEEQHA